MSIGTTADTRDDLVLHHNHHLYSLLPSTLSLFWAEVLGCHSFHVYSHVSSGHHGPKNPEISLTAVTEVVKGSVKRSVALKRQRAPPIVGSAMWVYIATRSNMSDSKIRYVFGCASHFCVLIIKRILIDGQVLYKLMTVDS